MVKEELASEGLVVTQLLQKIEKMPNLEDVKIPYVIKDKVLMSPGVWNNYYYGADIIANSFVKTDWSDKEIRSLFLDHEDMSSREWIGEIINPRIKDDSIMGDLVIVDLPTAQKLAYGAKMGISPKVHGEQEDGSMMSFLFDNFSVVINPAIKTAYINNSENAAKEPYGDVPYADPGYRGDTKRYPIDTAAHVRAAWSYISVPKNAAFYTPDQLKNIKGRIRSAAKKFGIKIQNSEEVKMSKKEIKNEEGDVTPEDKPQEDPKKEDAAKVEDQPTEDKSAEDKPAEDKPAEEPAKENSEKDAIKELRGEIKTLKEAFSKMNKSDGPKEMSQTDIVNQIVKLAHLLLSEDGAEPAKEEDKPTEDKPAEETKSVEKENKEVVNKMQEEILKLTKTVSELNGKLNEPAGKKTVKAELSQADAEALVKQDPDGAFLNMLQNLG